MSSDLYRFVGTSTFPRKDGNGAWYILFLDEKQPDGQYRPMMTYSRGNRTAGVFIDLEVYNAVTAAGFKYGEPVLPMFGPNNRILAVTKA